MAARASSTRSSGTPRPSGRSTTSAAAPRCTASGAKSWPSTLKPGTQKKSVPGVTARLSYASASTSTAGAPSPIRSRRVTGGESSAGSGASGRRDPQVRQRERDDLLEGRRGHQAAVDLALRLVDHHGHEQARIAGRCEADERREVLRLRVAAVDRVGLLRRAGLAGERVAVDLRLLRRAA